ncbi:MULTISPECIES: type II toxin-antitoxin system RelE/ParE family toxin [Methylobacterium]|uniref:Plasmid stabilization system protein n=2 Tax=Methylobacterium TaxID=407 RepID=A0A0C6G1T7_9HYPH|nr:type II toxin-antitoxin system RelE/ParE family toxin [Methylobacterium aquaticum]BAQ49955.1 plasmid stabilization system protein [Methylobacterium aquaticum]
MSGYVLMPAAQADVAKIRDYTAEQWSREQATLYICAIQEACEGLASGMRISRPVDVQPAYLKSTSNRTSSYPGGTAMGWLPWFAFFTAAWMWSGIFDNKTIPYSYQTTSG